MKWSLFYQFCISFNFTRYYTLYNNNNHSPFLVVIKPKTTVHVPLMYSWRFYEKLFWTLLKKNIQSSILNYKFRTWSYKNISTRFRNTILRILEKKNHFIPIWFSGTLPFFFRTHRSFRHFHGKTISRNIHFLDIRTLLRGRWHPPW